MKWWMVAKCSPLGDQGNVKSQETEEKNKWDNKNICFLRKDGNLFTKLTFIEN